MNTAPIAAELTTLRELVVTLKEALELTRQENVMLRQKIDSLVRRVFGASSEKLDRAQLDLLLQLPISTEATIPAAAVEASKAAVSRSRKDRAPRLPENLPVVEEVIEPEPVKASPEQWRCIGQEVSEQLDYEPARFLRRRVIRKKYVSRTDIDLAPVIAPLPECLQERALPRRACWRRFWLANTATICRCIGRNRFSCGGIKCICRVRLWRDGWRWLPTG